MTHSEMVGVYFHIPFCRRRCAYCDFYFITNTGLIEQFLVALEKEVRAKAPLFEGQPVGSVYFGGGTPSLLDDKSLAKILSLAHTCFKIDPEAEITLEANPEDLTEEKVRGLRALSVNRLSLGLQSFNQKKLETLTRKHTAAESLKAAELARKYFENLNLDLIFGSEGESLQDWLLDLETALQFDPPHLSTYSLTIEPQTLLWKMIETGKRHAPEDALQTEMFLLTMQRLREAGFDHYEVSNFAKAGRESRHNLACWNREPYLGFGPAAHSFVKIAGQERRLANKSSLKAYFELPENALDFEEALSEKDILNETVFLELRQGKGLDMVFLEKRRKFPHPFLPEGKIEQFVGQGLMFREGNRLRLTDKGFTLADTLAEDLIV
ncbi:MAG: radical SAM family heme chaperone HemW [Chlorobiales bacterium]|nr:radical SAM family heme chaperone HemW [Chlorobiales bacterium]